MKYFLIIIVFLCNIGILYCTNPMSSYYRNILTEDSNVVKKDKPLYRIQFDFGGTRMTKYGYAPLLYYGGIGKNLANGQLYMSISGAYRKKNTRHPYPNLGSYNGEYTDLIGTFDIGVRLAKTFKISPVIGLSYVYYLNKASYNSSNSNIQEYVGEGYKYDYQLVSPYFRIDVKLIDNALIFANYRTFNVFKDLSYYCISLGVNCNL